MKRAEAIIKTLGYYAKKRELVIILLLGESPKISREIQDSPQFINLFEEDSVTYDWVRTTLADLERQGIVELRNKWYLTDVGKEVYEYLLNEPPL